MKTKSILSVISMVAFSASAFAYTDSDIIRGDSITDMYVGKNTSNLGNRAFTIAGNYTWTQNDVSVGTQPISTGVQIYGHTSVAPAANVIGIYAAGNFSTLGQIFEQYSKVSGVGSNSTGNAFTGTYTASDNYAMLINLSQTSVADANKGTSITFCKPFNSTGPNPRGSPSDVILKSDFNNGIWVASNGAEGAGFEFGKLTVSSKGTNIVDNAVFFAAADNKISFTDNITMTNVNNITLAGAGDFEFSGSQTFNWNGDVLNKIILDADSTPVVTFTGTSKLIFDTTKTFTADQTWTILEDLGSGSFSFNGSIYDSSNNAFTKSGDIWTSGDYSFNQSTGVLSYAAVPEPAELAALMGLLSLGFIYMRRRK